MALLEQRGFNFHAVFAGTNLDYNNDSLVSLLNSKGLISRVHLLGRRNDITSIMNGIDLFILSSISEAFPNVLNEAMACGTPCITTDVGDASFIVKNTGWIVMPKNPKLIVDAVIDAEDEFRSRTTLWLKRKDDCHERIKENFSLKKMTQKYKELWRVN